MKNQVSYLLWNGKIETTLARAKEVQKLAEKNLTLAINTYQDVVKVQKTKVVNGKETKVHESSSPLLSTFRKPKDKRRARALTI